ncbi:MAG: response regulator [Bacteroidota bacterium]
MFHYHEGLDKEIIGEYVETMYDSSSHLSVSDVRESSEFVASSTNALSLPVNDGNYWLRGRFSNNSNQRQDLYLWIDNFDLFEVELFVFDRRDSLVYYGENGESLPQERRAAKGHMIAFPFEIQANQEYQFYFRIKSLGLISIPLYVVTREEYIAKKSYLNFLRGGEYLVLLIFVVLMVFFYRATHDRNYLFYLLFFAVDLVANLFLDGTLGQLWSEAIVWANGQGDGVTAIALVVTFNLFTSYFMGLNKLAPKLYLVVRIYLLIATTTLLTMAILPKGLLLLAVPLTIIGGYSLPLIGSIIGLRKKRREAKYLFGYFSGIFVMCVIYTIYVSGMVLLPDSLIQALPAVSVLLITILTLGMTEKINILREEREVALQEKIVESAKVIALNQKLEGQNQQLESIVAERTAEIRSQNEEIEQKNEALIEAIDKAEAAGEAKANFLATMSHEIRTPLNAVIGMTGLLAESELDRTQADYVSTIKTSGDSLLTLINDILDFSKIESGKLELEIQSFNVLDPIEEVLDLLGAKARAKQIQLAYLAEKQLPELIESDITRLRQILLNLTGNAIKFTGQGEVNIRLEAEPIAEEQGSYHFHFSVQDTGIGIPKERQSRLFQSFSQIDASTTRKYGGSGLGLAISKQLVQLMGGEIWVESEEGKGSTFHFTIRAKAKAAPQTASFRGKRVMIIEDHQLIREMLQQIARTWSMEPLVFSDIESALSFLDGSPELDMVWVDDLLSDGYGSFVTERMRETPQYAQLPMVMLSNELSIQSSELKAKHAAWISKPVRRQQLLRICEQHFTAKQAQVEETTAASPNDWPAPTLRILLTEDNPVNQKVATRMLGKIGYEADIANNGLEALEAIQRIPYDLILMDVQMPEMDGLTATREIIRMYGGSAERPVIVAMTANAMKEDQEKCAAAGMDDYISKPVRLSILKERLAYWERKKCQVESA